MAPIHSSGIVRLAHKPKTFLASGFTSGVCGSLNMRSSVIPIMPLAQPAFENMRVITDRVYSWRCPDNSFTDWWSMGKMLSGLQGDFSLQYCEWPLEKSGSEAEQRCRIQLL